VRYEDPVGSSVLTGRDAVGAHLAAAVRGHVHEVPGTPVAAFDTEHVLLPASATLDSPQPAGTRLKVTFIALARIGPDELIHEMRFFWGRSDAAPVIVGPDTA
jgi:steroid delta-isomerase